MLLLLPWVTLILEKALDPEAWASWRRAPSRRPPAWRRPARCWSWMQPLDKQPIQEIHWKRWNMFNGRGYSYLKLNVWKWPRSLPFSCAGPRWPCPSGSPGKDIYCYKIVIMVIVMTMLIVMILIITISTIIIILMITISMYIQTRTSHSQYQCCSWY